MQPSEDAQQQPPQVQHESDSRKEPETLSEGERMGLSKQQLRKLAKKLQADKKRKKKEEEEELAKQAHHPAQEKDDKNNKKNKKKNKQEISQEYAAEFNSQSIPLTPNQCLPNAGNRNILVTSALPYVNNVPHLGNIIGCVLSADVYARFARLQGYNTLYISGTDEYGTATEVKALQQGKSPKQICDYYHAIHKEVYEWFDISFDIFGRTSTEWHTKICQEIFMDLMQNKKILKQSMTQCYCQKCDLFLADRFIRGTCPKPDCNYEDARGDQCDKCGGLFGSPTQMKDYRCSLCMGTPVERQTEHFFIDLPKIQKQLEEWIEISSLKGKWSDNSISTTKAWTNMGLKPKCITRDLKWGVSVPIEQYRNKVFYVWYDAPIGYISITAHLLGEDYRQWWKNKNVELFQFMGKDNVPFHTVIFPSSLIGANADWTLLHHISTTEYLNYESGKFSKRRGVGIFGDSAKQLGIPAQVWRYYLLDKRPEKSDSEFKWDDFVEKNNSQLIANLGNLCHRFLEFCHKYEYKAIPQVSVEKAEPIEIQLLKQVEEKYRKYVENLNQVNIREGLKICMEISSLGNKYLQDSKYYKLPKESERIHYIIATTFSLLRLLSLVFEPYLPPTSAKINFLLGIQRGPRDNVLGKFIDQTGFRDAFYQLTDNSTLLRTPIPLFKQLSPEDAEKWRQMFKGTSTTEPPN